MSITREEDLSCLEENITHTVARSGKLKLTRTADNVGAPMLSKTCLLSSRSTMVYVGAGCDGRLFLRLVISIGMTYTWKEASGFCLRERELYITGGEGWVYHDTLRTCMGGGRMYDCP